MPQSIALSIYMYMICIYIDKVAPNSGPPLAFQNLPLEVYAVSGLPQFLAGRRQSHERERRCNARATVPQAACSVHTL